MMNNKVDTLRKTRAALLGFVNDLSVAQMNEIPEGFNNNIAWNLGHLVATQQGICYGRAGLPLHVRDDFFAAYKPETKPQRFIDDEEILAIKKLFAELPDRFEQDYENNLFAGYTPWKNRYDVALAGIDDAMTFVLFHEGLHLGYIMALKRSIRK